MMTWNTYIQLSLFFFFLFLATRKTTLFCQLFKIFALFLHLRSVIANTTTACDQVGGWLLVKRRGICKTDEGIRQCTNQVCSLGLLPIFTLPNKQPALQNIWIPRILRETKRNLLIFISTEDLYSSHTSYWKLNIFLLILYSTRVP